MCSAEVEEQEARKYQRVWAECQYREQSDGVPVAGYAFEAMGCEPGQTLIDWGCGTGRVAALFKRWGLSVTGFDIASNCLDRYGVSGIPLVVGTLWNPPAGLEADYAFCADVLEHIPPQFIPHSLDAIAYRTRKAAYIQVDTVLDISGPAMDPPEVLHLTVKPKKWWQQQLEKRWATVLSYPGSYSREGFLCR